MASEVRIVLKRMDVVRDAVTEAARGLSPAGYRDLLENLISEADGWKALLADFDAEDDQPEPGRVF